MCLTPNVLHRLALEMPPSNLYSTKRQPAIPHARNTVRFTSVCRQKSIHVSVLASAFARQKLPRQLHTANPTKTPSIENTAFTVSRLENRKSRPPPAPSFPLPPKAVFPTKCNQKIHPPASENLACQACTILRGTLFQNKKKAHKATLHTHLTYLPIRVCEAWEKLE